MNEKFFDTNLVEIIFLKCSHFTELLLYGAVFIKLLSGSCNII